MSGGQLGVLPDWVPIMQAAIIMGVKAWELAGFNYAPHEIPTCWITWALQYQRVDLGAKKHFRAQAEADRAGQLGT